MERLSKYLAKTGLGSRRVIDGYISRGKITVNGRRAVLGQRVDPKIDEILVDGRCLAPPEKRVYFAVNKPQGYLSTCSDPYGRPTVTSLVKTDKRIFPVGRLDYDTCGLIFLTNDGEFCYALTHPKHNVVKKYHAKVKGARDFSKIRALLSGVTVNQRVVKADFASFLKKRGQYPSLSIGVHEGEKHLVKNLLKAVGYEVLGLRRVKIGPVSLEGIAEGGYRNLAYKEVKALYEAAGVDWEGEERDVQQKSSL